MTTTTSVPIREAASGDELLRRRPGRWIDHWDPEDDEFWNTTGKRTARRNLVFSIVSEHIGFSVWVIWSVMVLFMPQTTWGFSVADKFLITIVPAAVGSVLRIPYTFAVARFGGRNWTVTSALLLLIPSATAGFAVKPGISLTEILLVSALFGLGGGNFASSMANINNFYPQRLKGWALGLNAGGGNIGVASVQIVAAIVVAGVGTAVDPRVILYVYMPLIVAVAIAAWLTMDNLSEARNDKGAIREVVRHGHTWIISLLYIGTFGSFIGFGFAFGQVLTAGGVANPIYYVWIGAFAGSLIRPVGGKLVDRYTGSRVTFWNFIAMTLSTVLVLAASKTNSTPLFVTAFTLLFALTGIGNGSVYKMIPAIFHGKAVTGAITGFDERGANFHARRLASALVGVAGAVGAFGGVLVQIAFRQSFLSLGNGDAAYLTFTGLYLGCALLTWAVYIRAEDDALTVV